jgi:hypothetical protein
VGCTARSVLLLAAIFSSGCLVVSLQPAYDDESVAFEEALLGRWTNADDQTQATIERGEWRSYRVSYTDRFGSRTFQGNLTRIGANTLLDLTEMRGADPGPYLLPVHGIFRVEVNGDTLTAAPLDYGWFTRAMVQKTIGRLTAALDDRRHVVIASATADLRRWLTHPPTEAFAAPMTFRRTSEIARAGDAIRPPSASVATPCRPWSLEAPIGIRSLRAPCRVPGGGGSIGAARPRSFGGPSARRPRP